MDPCTSPFLLVEEAADFCGTSTTTIRRWIKEGKIPSYKVGRRHLIPRRAFFATISEGGQLILPLTQEPDQ